MATGTRESTLQALLATTLVTLFCGTVSHAAPGARFAAETVRQDASMRISASLAHHTCQVNEDGSVRCWGNNDDGQLGNGNTTFQPTPVPVTGLTTAVAVAAGGDSDFRGGFTCALLMDGTARCFGANQTGQLGDGTLSTNRLSPVAVAGLTNAVAITAGRGHACALLSTGLVRCWGENDDGQLGDGTTVTRLTPVLVRDVLNAVAIDAGDTHTCAVLVDGTARCWGSNPVGEIGDGSLTRRPSAVEVKGLRSVVSISAGYHNTCALLANGTARCWGWNRHGQLGNGSTVDQSATPVSVQMSNAVAISAGWVNCALLANGTARCWGFNNQGQLGDGSSGTSVNPIPTLTALTSGVAITTGELHTCAVLANGAASCWGSNATGQLGIGPEPFGNPLPIAVAGGGGGFSARDVAAGGDHTCAVRANGTVACWGHLHGLLPVTVPGLNNVTAVAAGNAHTCALSVDSTVWCWGDNGLGQLGNRTTTDSFFKPVRALVAGIVAIAAAGDHTCALRVTGSVLCWGANAHGQLGNGTTTPSSLPVVVTGSAQTVAIAAGGAHTCAVRVGGTVRCWGANNSGQLGNSALVPHPQPVPVDGLASAVAPAAGSLHTCALLANGGTRCWGENLLGQLGDDSHASRHEPEPVIGLSANLAVAIAGGRGHSCAVLIGGGAQCRGDNTEGQLGNATTTSTTRPAVVETVRILNVNGFGGSTFQQTVKLPLTHAVTVTAGLGHTCALLSTGGLRCWGENSFGQLGIGTTTNALSPAAVPSFMLNIDTTVVLEDNDRVARVTIVANCEVDQTLQFDIALTQGEVTATRRASGRCTGDLERYPMKVQLFGNEQFSEGAARVAAVAIIKDGRVVETQEWSRQVQIVRMP